MALIKCIDCGKMFSSHAAACPECGCPIEYCLNKQAEATTTSAAVSETAEELVKQANAAYNDENYDQAFSLFCQAAEMGNAEAQYGLGKCYYYGEGVEEDEEKMIEWLRKAAEQGYAKALYQMGERYYYGEGVEQDEDKMVEWFRKAAEQGDAKAQLFFGDMYEGEDEKLSKEWYAKALEQLLETAEQGDAEAQYYLGECYFYGNGVTPDFQKALEWYRKSADLGYEDAEYDLEALINTCLRDAKSAADNEDWDEAFSLYHLAAEDGIAEAQYQIGFCYYEGNGVEEDEKQAFEWFRRAAEQGHTEALYRVGFCYFIGAGVEENIKEAVKWLYRPAEHGHMKAQNLLGEICFPVSKDEAFKWYSLAAEQGHEGALSMLAEMYYKGLGVTEDREMSASLYLKAAETGGRHSYYYDELTKCYEKGYCADQIIELFRKDAENGSTKAQHWLRKHLEKNGFQIKKYANSDVYEGVIVNGIRNGKGKMTYANGAVYEGDWVNDKRHGKGKMTYAKGDVYEGDWVNDERHGRGKYTFVNGRIYEGEWKNHNQNGKGKFTFSNGDVYEGDFVDNKRTGKAKYIWVSGTVYEGDFINGYLEGYGKKTYTDGTIEEGQWHNDKLVKSVVSAVSAPVTSSNSSGTFSSTASDYSENRAQKHLKESRVQTKKYANGDVYEGDMVNGKRHGKGKMTYANGEIEEGDWLNDVHTGKGKYTYSDGTYYEGDFVNGKFEGYGEIINGCRKLHAGLWQNNNLVKTVYLHKKTTDPKILYDQGTTYAQLGEYEKAFEKFKYATKYGNPRAAKALADCYQEGRGVQKNLQLAEKYRKKAKTMPSLYY